MPRPFASQQTTLIDRLAQEHDGVATRDDVTTCVAAAFEAIGFFGSTDDPDMLGLAARIAERDLRLRLGLEREAARLDPENHRRPA